MSFFPPNNILEEEIVTQRNLDPDCEAIGHLLERFGEKFILSALEDAQYSIAVDNYLQMLDSLTEHFIADEHWCWFDDFYSPDYTVSRIWDEFIPHMRSGALAGEPSFGRNRIRPKADRTDRGIPKLNDSVLGLEEF